MKAISGHEIESIRNRAEAAVRERRMMQCCMWDDDFDGNCAAHPSGVASEVLAVLEGIAELEDQLAHHELHARMACEWASEHPCGNCGPCLEQAEWRKPDQEGVR